MDRFSFGQTKSIKDFEKEPQTKEEQTSVQTSRWKTKSMKDNVFGVIPFLQKTDFFLIGWLELVF